MSLTSVNRCCPAPRGPAPGPLLGSPQALQDTVTKGLTSGKAEWGKGPGMTGRDMLSAQGQQPLCQHCPPTCWRCGPKVQIFQFFERNFQIFEYCFRFFKRPQGDISTPKASHVHAHSSRNLSPRFPRPPGSISFHFFTRRKLVTWRHWGTLTRDTLGSFVPGNPSSLR